MRQKRLFEFQKDFINNMTHEFKTPLSTIRIAAEVFRSDAHIRDDERLSKYAKLILDQEGRINNQVEKILQVAGYENGKINFKLEEVQFISLLNTFSASAQAAATQQPFSFAANLPEQEFNLQLDPTHMNNILWNLLENAIKYGGPEVEIMLSFSKSNKYYEVSMSDSGPGISKSDQKYIFQKFYRVQKGNLQSAEGFGLGLYYVKKVIDQLQWKIDVKSSLGQGSTFTIYIPKPKK